MVCSTDRDDDGAPRGERWFALWNPPLDDAGTRGSSHRQAASLLAGLVDAGHRSIAFTRSRRMTEVVAAGGTTTVVDEAVGAALVVVDAGDFEADRTCGVLPPEAHAAVSTTTPRHMTRRDLIGSEQFEFVGSQPA